MERLKEHSGERQTKKKTFSPFCVFAHSVLCCFLLALLFESALRGAFYSDNGEEKIYENTLFWLQYVMCAYLISLCTLRDTTALRCLFTAVTIVEVFHLSLSFILQACQMWDLYNRSVCSAQDSYMQLVQMFGRKI